MTGFLDQWPYDQIQGTPTGALHADLTAILDTAKEPQ